MIFNFISASSDKYSGLSIGKSILLGVIIFSSVLSIISGVYLLHWHSVLGVSLCLFGIIPLVAMPWWVRWYIGQYAQKIEKCMVTIKRVQNKSNYLESILQDSTDIIFTTDIDGYILKFNRGAEIHFKYTQTEIVGAPLRQLFVNEADERKILSSVLLSGKSVNEEVPMKTKDGNVLLVNLSMSEMKNDYNQIIGLVVTAIDITEKKKLEMELVRKNELLSKLAITDSLTELYNLRHFYDQLTRELTRFKRNPSRFLSLIMLDIDHFKELNDSEGHQMGDHVLKSLSQVIKAGIRKDIDSAYRYGGDEFVIILPDADRNQAKIAAQRIQKQFGAFKFGPCSLSIGIAQARPQDDEKSIIRRADEAMYQAKKDGRSRIVLENDSIEEDSATNCNI